MIPYTPSRRFAVLGGPGGYLATSAAGAARDFLHRHPRWQVLFWVNRPPTPALLAAALDAVSRHYELAP